MPTFTIKQYQCPECHYTRNLDDNEEVSMCPACGNGLPNNMRASGFSSYRGHTQTSFRDGSVRPTKQEIDEDIRTGKLKDKTGQVWN